MALSKNNPKFFETGSISFSDIKNTFGGSGETNIKASQYLRELNEADLDDDITTPTIPDSVENSDIPTSQSNWSIEAFRGSNKEIEITQSGEEADLSLDENSDIWDGNLDKNIPKRLVIDGTVYSTGTATTALILSGNMRNLDVVVSAGGSVYGEGGSSSQDGGDALYIRNLRSTSPVDLYVYGKVWSGGGGGSPGNSGNSGSRLTCTSTNYFNTTASSPNGGRFLREAAPGNTCRSVRSGSDWYSASPTGTRNRCRGGGVRRAEGDAVWGAGRSKRGNYQCSANWSVRCEQTENYNASGGNGGNAGSGGNGQGFARSKSDGNDGNSGNCNSCGNKTSCGNDGNSGSAGGDWGQEGNGGKAGAAISKRNVRIQYSTSNTLKGREIDIEEIDN